MQNVEKVNLLRILHSTFMLSSHFQSFGEALGQTGGADFFLRGGDVVFQPAQFDGAGVRVVDDIGGFGIIVARLADGSDVDELFFGRINFEFGVGAAAHHGIAHEGNRHMGMAKETELGVLVGKTGRRRQFVKHVTPALGRIERGVDDGEVVDQFGVLQVTEPLALLVGKLCAGPTDGLGGVGIESFQMVIGGTVFVVVALHAGDVHVANDLETFLGVGVVTDDIAQADVMGGLLLFSVGQNGPEGFQIAVNVSDDGEFHLRLSNNFKSD